MLFSRFRAQTALVLVGLAAITGILAFTAPGASSSENTGETYVEAMVGAPRFVNPLLASSDTDTDLTHLVYSGLTRVDDTGNIAPDLAGGWQVSPDVRTYTFTLRPNLHWQDGSPLTAADIYFTINLLKDKDFPGDPALAAPWRDVQVGEAISSTDTVVFTLPRPDASFLQYTTLGILPQHVWSDVNLDSPEPNLQPVGSGPWKFVRNPATPTVQASTTLTQEQALSGVILEPNPDSPTAPPSLSRIWFRPYPTFGAALTGFEMGEVHGLGHIPDDQLDVVRAVPGTTLHQAPLARYTMLLINVASPLFDKPQTRRAIELAIDRDAVARAANGAVAVSPVLTGSWAYDDAVPRRGYDPAEARRELDAAGWSPGADGIRARNGTRLSVVLAANKDASVDVEVVKLISEQLRAVGIDLQPALVSHDSLVNDYLGPRAYHLALVSWGAAGADPDLFAYWHSSQNTTGFDYTGWVNSQADSDLQDALNSPDQAIRTRLYFDFQQLFASDVPAVLLFDPLYTYATRDPAGGGSLPKGALLSPAQRFDTISDWYLSAGK